MMTNRRVRVAIAFDDGRRLLERRQLPDVVQIYLQDIIKIEAIHQNRIDQSPESNWAP